MTYGLSNGHVTDDVKLTKGQTRDSNTLRAQYLERLDLETPKDRQRNGLYGPSNGHVTDDVA